MSEITLVDNIKESATLVGISAGVGIIIKKLLKRDVLGDPSDNFMNATQWIVIILIAIYVRDYLIKNKYLPKK